MGMKMKIINQFVGRIGRF